MGIYEYNQEEHIRMEREDAKREGLSLAKQVLRLFNAGTSLQEISNSCNLSVEQVRDLLEK